MQLDDPLKLAGELSGAELACASTVADPGRLMQIFSAPEMASRDEMSQLINCLEDETVLRMFITDLVGLEEPLSEEASVCIRGGLDGVDARTVMLSGMAGDAQAAMAGSMSSFLLVLTCLNDEEFAAAAPALGVPVDEREGMLCLLGELGGPENFIAAFSGQDEEAMLKLFGAAAACDLDMGGAPAMSEVPDSGEPGMPVDPLASALADLSDDELACLAGAGIGPETMMDPSAMASATPEMQAQVMGCLNDETLLTIYLGGLVGDPSLLSVDTKACIQAGLGEVDLRQTMMAGPPGDEESMVAGAISSVFIAVSCMSDQELEAAGPVLGMTPDDRAGIECVMEQMGGPENMAVALASEDGAGLMAFMTAAMGCGLQMDMGP